MYMNKILALYVIFNPDNDILKRSISCVSNYVETIWITDNSKEKHDIVGEHIIYSHQSENKGIAYGQNLGIRYAIDNSYDWILFFDQDSQFNHFFFENYFKSFNALLGYDADFYGMGPMAINMDSGMVLNLKSMQDSIVIGTNRFVKVRELMCSASVMRTELFQRVGLMDESLFIDGVDFEICWRSASQINAHFYLAKECTLKHQLGEGDRVLLGRTIHIPTPFRVYYQVRNGIFLSRRKYVPIGWKVLENIKSVGKLLIFPLFVSPRWLYLKMILKGYRDGLLGNRFKI